VQHGKYYVHAQRIWPRIADGNKGRDIRIGGEHDAFAGTQNVGSILCAAVPASHRPSFVMPMGSLRIFRIKRLNHGRCRD